MAALWLLGVAFAVFSWQWHGMLDSRLDPVPPPDGWLGVVVESALIGLECLALFWLLFKVEAWGPLARTLAAAMLYAALVAFGLSTFGSDPPGWCRVTTRWSMLVLLMLAWNLAVQVVAAALARVLTGRV